MTLEELMSIAAEKLPSDVMFKVDRAVHRVAVNGVMSKEDMRRELSDMQLSMVLMTVTANVMKSMDKRPSDDTFAWLSYLLDKHKKELPERLAYACERSLASMQSVLTDLPRIKQMAEAAAVGYMIGKGELEGCEECGECEEKKTVH